MLKVNNITLDDVKKSNYWKLISLIVWNHYNEERYQDESLINIEERWYGKGLNGTSSSHSDYWNNPEYTKNNFIRTLDCIIISLNRTDYTTNIYLNAETGNITYLGFYNDKEIKKQPYFYGVSMIECMNWMIEHNFIKYI